MTLSINTLEALAITTPCEYERHETRKEQPSVDGSGTVRTKAAPIYCVPAPYCTSTVKTSSRRCHCVHEPDEIDVLVLWPRDVAMKDICGRGWASFSWVTSSGPRPRRGAPNYNGSGGSVRQPGKSSWDSRPPAPLPEWRAWAGSSFD